MSGGSPGFQLDVVNVEISPAGAVSAGGFGVDAVVVAVPLRVYDLILNVGGSALDGIFWDVMLPTESGVNYRTYTIGLSGNALRISIVDAAGAAADLLTSFSVRGRRFGAPT